MIIFLDTYYYTSNSGHINELLSQTCYFPKQTQHKIPMIYGYIQIGSFMNRVEHCFLQVLSYDKSVFYVWSFSA